MAAVLGGARSKKMIYLNQKEKKAALAFHEPHYVANQNKAKQLWFQRQLLEIILHSKTGLL
nr:hypothetical protein [uncultured Undibacterium sp.]